MSLQSQTPYVVPAETAKVAHAIFPKGNLCITMAEALHECFSDENFEVLYPHRGQPAASPLRLALATVLQYVEGLIDRQTADAVRSRIDWKYLLGLELTDIGDKWTKRLGIVHHRHSDVNKLIHTFRACE